MFDLAGDDIARLTPADLRLVVAQLARAELRAAGQPVSGVTAGGHENAADGGIDVRVCCQSGPVNLNFLPRLECGLQVKQAEMRPGSIGREMRPGGALRPAIAALGDAGGAYIIVSGKDSVPDGQLLTARRKAMRHALRGLPGADALLTDFYDRTQVAAWAGLYPGIVLWIRARTGRPLDGWHSMDQEPAAVGPLLHDDTVCMTDSHGACCSVTEGLTRLRHALRQPRACVRLVGLSGVGKTRLVQALFDLRIGEAALDPSIAAYADEGESITPTAHEMARRLVAENAPAILIVDNCNPETHRQLTEIIARSAGAVSLLTVEYDVGGDTPERTEVYRLDTASTDLLASWLLSEFPDIGEPDRTKISEYSGGNFRIGRVLAQSIGPGETIGHLRDQQLLARIVRQRHPHDERFLRAAEVLSLLYSIDGEATGAGSELALMGSLHGIAARHLYADLVTLKKRGIAQARGRWRAVLPQAIGNALAISGMERLPPSDLDEFVAGLPDRMQRSLSRRVGHLHGSNVVRDTVRRWLSEGSPFGDLFVPDADKAAILTNIARVAPDMVLFRMARVLEGRRGQEMLSTGASARTDWIRLIKGLALEASHFETAAELLIRYASAELTETRNDSATAALQELFLVLLSGTRASPAQRRALVARLAASGDVQQQRLAAMALEQMLRSHHLSATYHDAFGTGSRDYGWMPSDDREGSEWYVEAIELAVRLSGELPQSRRILAREFRTLWHMPECPDALERAGHTLARQGSWIEGWLAARATLRMDHGMRSELEEHLRAVVAQFEPSNPLDFARAVMLRSRPGGWDFAEGLDGADETARWQQAALIAREIGHDVAQDAHRRRQLLPELLSQPGGSHLIEFGRGLAERAADAGAIWTEVMGDLRQISPERRVTGTPIGMLLALRERFSNLVDMMLDELAGDAELVHMLPGLQAAAGFDDVGIARIRRLVAGGTVAATEFNTLALGPTSLIPADVLATLLLDVAGLPDGVSVAVQVLHFRFYHDDQAGRPIGLALIDAGRELLRHVPITGRGLRDHVLQGLIERCIAGPSGEQVARDLGDRLRRAVLDDGLYPNDLSGTFTALASAHPAAVMDVFTPAQPTWQDERILHHGLGWGASLDRVDPHKVRDWADQEPEPRYARLGRVLSMFTSGFGGKPQALSPIFMALLDGAPDRIAFLGKVSRRLDPGGWSGSLADILEQRRALLLPLQDGAYPEVRRWVADLLPDLHRRIEDARASERQREHLREEGFECKRPVWRAAVVVDAD